MDFVEARSAVLAVLRDVRAGDRSRLLHWMRTTNNFDEFMLSNNDVVLRSIAEDLRNCLPIEAMLSSEHLAIQKILEQPEPTVHVDAFLYDDDIIDSLCEKGKMSRNYCVVCGSHKTAPLEFISHSFSLMELKFLYQYALPDLTGKILVDVGSRLGAVLFGADVFWHSYFDKNSPFGQKLSIIDLSPKANYFRIMFRKFNSTIFEGYLYSSASQLYGVEMNADFCQLQEMIITKYQFTDRVQVLHSDICTQASLLQNADVVVMNNVFEYFLDRLEQARAWEFISHNMRKKGSLLVTVPSLEESISNLQTDILLNQWVEEMKLDYDVYMEKDIDREALEQIHLYKIL